jgi:hypothetical protein
MILLRAREAVLAPVAAMRMRSSLPAGGSPSCASRVPPRIIGKEKSVCSNFMNFSILCINAYS